MPTFQEGIPVEDLIGGEFTRRTEYSTVRQEGRKDWLLLYTVAGCGRLMTARGPVRLPKKHALIYSPKEPQHYGTDPDTGRWHLLFSPFVPRASELALLDLPRGRHGLQLIDASACSRALEAALRRLYRQRNRDLACDIGWAYHALEEALLLLAEAAATRPESAWDPRLREAVGLLGEQLANPPSTPQLAASVGLSVSRLNQLFNQTLGMPARQYAETLRLRHARELLRRTQLRVGEVAEACGYDDPLYFSTRYRKVHGHSPRAERTSG